MMSHMFTKVTLRTTYATLFFVFAFLLPSISFASSSDSLNVAGWMPYWRDSEAIKDAKKNIKDIDTVYPFAYSVQSDGAIKDLAGLTDKEWQSFMKLARSKDIEVIPTVMWSDGTSIHNVLSQSESRKNHIGVIMHMVEKGKYDGVDIDYESKKAETKDYFSLFIKELKAELGAKLLTCTVEARTPPESLYTVVPATIQYSNDYKEIAKYCDRVEIMGYDQQRADLLLNKSKNGAPYMPVADVDWVEKVVKLALKDIPKEKLVLGIPTYGHHYAVTVAPDWFKNYQKIGALNVPSIKEIAKEYKVTPTRNKAGEMSFTYLPKSSDIKLSSKLKIPKDTPKGNIVAARALAYANKTGEEVTFNLAWYSDATAIEDKIKLAKKYDLFGIALFKIDGEEDSKIWNLID